MKSLNNKSRFFSPLRSLVVAGCSLVLWSMPAAASDSIQLTLAQTITVNAGADFGFTNDIRLRSLGFRVTDGKATFYANDVNNNRFLSIDASNGSVLSAVTNTSFHAGVGAGTGAGGLEYYALSGDTAIARYRVGVDSAFARAFYTPAGNTIRAVESTDPYTAGADFFVITYGSVGNNLQRVSYAGASQILATTPLPVASLDLAFDSYRNLYVLGSDNTIYHYDTQTMSLVYTYLLPEGFLSTDGSVSGNYVTGIAFDTVNNELWVSSNSTNALYRDKIYRLDGIVVVPEPATVSLVLATGIFLFVAARRIRCKA